MLGAGVVAQWRALAYYTHKALGSTSSTPRKPKMKQNKTKKSFLSDTRSVMTGFAAFESLSL
jgi:hypothetical protein